VEKVTENFEEEGGENVVSLSRTNTYMKRYTQKTLTQEKERIKKAHCQVEKSPPDCEGKG